MEYLLHSYRPLDVYIPQKSPIEDDCPHQYIQNSDSSRKVCRICGLVDEIPLFSDYSPSVVLSNLDSYSKPKTPPFYSLPPSLQRALKLDRMRTWHERKVDLGLNEIKRISSQRNTGAIIQERASFLFKQAVQQSDFRGHYIKMLALVCFFHSCRENTFPFNADSYLREWGYSTRLCQRYYRQLRNTLKLPRVEKRPEHIVSAMCTTLKLPEHIAGAAVSLIQAYTACSNTSGKDQKGIAAGAIYFAAQLTYQPRSQQVIAEIARISDITLRSRFKELKKFFKNRPEFIERIVCH